MDSITRSKLKRLVTHGDWEVVYSLRSLLTESWHNVPVKADDEFNTVWNMAYKQGKVDGAREFLDSAEKLALDDE